MQNKGKELLDDARIERIVIDRRVICNREISLQAQRKNARPRVY